MYEAAFTITDDADWQETFELTNDETDANYDASDLEWTFQITENGRALLTARTVDGSMTRPADNAIAFRFTRAQVQGALCPKRTYQLGLIFEDSENKIGQLLYGTVAVIDGGLA
jgi:hypothetical protein